MSRYYVYGTWNQSDARVFHVARVGDQNSTPLATYGNRTAAENDAARRNAEATS